MNLLDLLLGPSHLVNHSEGALAILCGQGETEEWQNLLEKAMPAPLLYPAAYLSIATNWLDPEPVRGDQVPLCNPAIY